MKKTIAGLALTAASTTAMALIAPPGDTEFESRTVCLSHSTDFQGAMYARFCDETRNNNNPRLERVVTESGCTADQVAIYDSRPVTEPESQWNINISSCPNPNIVQL